MIGRVLWWLLSRALGDGLTMTDEMHDALLVAIREDAQALLDQR